MLQYERDVNRQAMAASAVLFKAKFQRAQSDFESRLANERARAGKAIGLLSEELHDLQETSRQARLLAEEEGEEAEAARPR